jgi:hypothetical protein
MNMTQKHRQEWFLPIESMAICGLLVLVQNAWCGQVDSEKIDLILRDIGASNTSLYVSSTQGVADPPLPSVMATIMTQQLAGGAGIKDWDEKNPKWKPIYDHIRADLEEDLPTLPAAAAAAYAEDRRCEAGKCYAQDIASNLQPADVDAILAYFDTPEGKRFQAFQQQIGSMYVTGLLSLVPHSLPQTAADHPNNRQDSQAGSIPPTSEQIQRCLRMLRLSILVQSTKAMIESARSGKQDTSDDVSMFFLGAAVARNKTKLEQLDLQYRNDLPGFEAFSETNASRHFIEAMRRAHAKSVSRTMSTLEGLQGIAKKHLLEWRALFKAELSQ